MFLLGGSLGAGGGRSLVLRRVFSVGLVFQFSGLGLRVLGFRGLGFRARV